MHAVSLLPYILGVEYNADASPETRRRIPEPPGCITNSMTKASSLQPKALGPFVHLDTDVSVFSTRSSWPIKQKQSFRLSATCEVSPV